MFLGSLAQDLMKIDQTRPEPWLAAASYYQLCDEKDRSLQLTDKVTRLLNRESVCVFLHFKMSNIIIE